MLNQAMKQNLHDAGLLMARVSVGLLMLINHGLPKMSKLTAGGEIKFPDPIGMGAGVSLSLAVGAEVVCSALLVVGLLTRVASVPLLITMLVAAFVIHADDPFAKKEFALMYAIPYLMLILTGPGRLSLDHLWTRRRQTVKD